MQKNEREREIINILSENNGFISVKELCSKLYASESSVRRDLTVLEGRGLINRTHGGAELVNNFSNVVAFSKRSHHNISAKRAIAKKAATLIRDGNVIFLDQSSTSFYLANEIMSNNTLTVITNNIEILSLMSDTGIKTISSGGFLYSENRVCLVGEDAEYIFNNSFADVMFFSVKSLAEDGSLWDPSREEILVRNAMLKNTAKRVFLCDSEKFGTRSTYKQCTLDDVDALVSEDDTAKRFKNVSKKLIVM